jgi:hypothetical protein
VAGSSATSNASLSEKAAKNQSSQLWVGLPGLLSQATHLVDGGLLPLKMRPIRLQPTHPALDYLPLFCDYQKSASARGVCINKSPLSEVAFIADEMRRTDFGRAHSADRKRMAAGYRAQAPACLSDLD